VSGGIEVAFSGRVGTVPEHKLVKGGTMPLCSFTVAVDTGATVQDGPAAVQWMRVTAFKDRAEALRDRLKKGDRVYCEGRLQLPVGTYHSRDGECRASVEVLANLVQPLGQIGRRRPRQSVERHRAQAMQAPGHWVDDTELAVADLERGR
jgi:single stranded DNA-binding protein